MTDYKIREDNIGKITLSQGEYIIPPLFDILYHDYKYLLERLYDEGIFRVDNAHNCLFKEIVYDKKVVGFSSYDYGTGLMALKYIYILPEYRGNNLLIKDIEDTIKLFKKHGFNHVAIDNPNFHVIKSLLKHDYAKRYNNHIIISKIPFSFGIKNTDSLTKEDIEFLESKGMSTENIKGVNCCTIFYDENIKACVSLETRLISAMIDEDSRNYPNLLFDRFNMDINYFEEFAFEIADLIKNEEVSITYI